MAKIDCSITMNFAKEFTRLCALFQDKCDDCPLVRICPDDFKDVTEETISIVQRWSDEHPIKTRKDVLLEKFPNAGLRSNGVPIVCVSNLGFENVNCDNVHCKECWNMPVEL